MKNIHRIIYILLVSSVINVHAENIEYDVEVVIFENTHQPYADSEHWDAVAESPDSNISQSKKLPQKLEFLTTDNSRLKSEIERLNESQEHKVLLHKIWRQPGLDTNLAFPVNLNSIDAVSAGNSRLSFVQGDLTLVMSRYLHIKGDMKYYKPTESDDGYGIYNLNIKRKMRSRELHYIDHPMFGILILVTPRT